MPYADLIFILLWSIESIVHPSSASLRIAVVYNVHSVECLTLSICQKLHCKVIIRKLRLIGYRYIQAEWPIF